MNPNEKIDSKRKSKPHSDIGASSILYVPIDDRSEQSIWTDFKKGSENALIYIYREYTNVLFNYGCQFTSRKEFVKDCIQDLFCELINKRERLAEVKSIKGYLFKSLKTRIFRGLKKEERLVLNDKDSLSFRIDSYTSHVSITKVFGREQSLLIKKKLNQLPAQQREIILLYFYEGLSYEEIGNIMGTKTKSVRTLCYRGLSSLSKYLKWSEVYIFLFLLGTSFHS